MSDMGIFIWQYDLTVGFCFQNHNPLESHNFSGLFEIWMLPPTEGLQASLKCSSAYSFSIPDRTQTPLAAAQKHSSFDNKLFCFQNVYLFFKMRYFKVPWVAALNVHYRKGEKNTFFPMTQFYEPNTYKYINKERERQ